MEEFYKRLNIIFKSLCTLDQQMHIFKRTFGNSFDFFNYVFLCGGNNKKYSSREKVKELFGNEVKFIIAEDFVKLRGKLDLLTFEKIFESISKVVLICIESAGTICELGAFTYISDDKNELSKEVVIYDRKKKNDDSFINKGPIEILNSLNDNRVFYSKYKNCPIGKKGFVFNDFDNLAKHRLITKSTVLSKYFDDKSGVLKIVDLTTIAALLLDLTIYIGYCNPKIFINFLTAIHNVGSIVFDSPQLKCNSKKVAEICRVYFDIFVELKVLSKKGELYFPQSTIVDESKERQWFGKVLFNDSFIESDYFGSRKYDFKKALELVK